MWTQFFWENIHFAINLLVALAFFSVFWLYFDAWVERKTLKEGFKILGFLLLAVAFLVEATNIESSVVVFTFLGGGINEKVSILLRNVGYLILALGLASDPLISKPKLNVAAIFAPQNIRWTTPLLAASVGWWYLRRATIGLENHTKKVALAFYFFAGYELLSLAILFRDTTNVDIFRLVSPFGATWIVAHVFELAGAGILISWAFSYLLKRINTQLFIIFTTMILTVFLITTVSFTYLLLKNTADESLSSLSTDMSVLTLSLDSKKAETVATASILASNQKVAEAISLKDRKSILTVVESLMLSRKVNSLVVVDGDGVVLVRGEDKERAGDSLSSDQLVKVAMSGHSVSSMVAVDQVVAPTMMLKVAEPIKINEKVVGVVVVGVSVDNTFLDEVKKVTGLEVGIYGGEVMAATTISNINSLERPIGVKEVNKSVKSEVLVNGHDYRGSITLLNASYFAVYRPLKDVNGNVIGMMLIARPAASIIASAARSMEMTFLLVGALIFLSITPSYLISEYITNQIN